MSSLRPDLRTIIDQLLALPELHIDLDLVADAIGIAAVSTQDVDEILTALEDAGRTVDVPAPTAASAELRRVLTAARQLRTQLGRTPSPQEIAQHAQLELSNVRVALLFARIVQR